MEFQAIQDLAADRAKNAIIVGIQQGRQMFGQAGHVRGGFNEAGRGLGGDDECEQTTGAPTDGTERQAALFDKALDELAPQNAERDEERNEVQGEFGAAERKNQEGHDHAGEE